VQHAETGRRLPAAPGRGGTSGGPDAPRAQRRAQGNGPAFTRTAPAPLPTPPLLASAASHLSDHFWHKHCSAPQHFIAPQASPFVAKPHSNSPGTSRRWGRRDRQKQHSLGAGSAADASRWETTAPLKHRWLESCLAAPQHCVPPAHTREREANSLCSLALCWPCNGAQ